MSIKKSDTQAYFEKMFTGPSGIPFRQFKKDAYEKKALSQEDANYLSESLRGEIIPYYYKALLSFLESIPSIENKLYSWSTVRLYYSVFYAIKSYLACKNVAILRAERKLYYVKAKESEKFKKCIEHTDHKGAILTLCRLFKKSDMLQTNNISDICVYDWMMRKREEINYKDLNFHDPYPPDFWEQISKEIDTLGITTLIEKLSEDNWLYCFQEEYAILAIPIKRLILTSKEIKNSGIQVSLEEEKENLIDCFFSKYPPSAREKINI